MTSLVPMPNRHARTESENQREPPPTGVERVAESVTEAWRRRIPNALVQAPAMSPSALGTTRSTPRIKAIQREQTKKRHQRLGALREVGDGFGLKGMQRPQDRDAIAQPAGSPPVAARRGQGARSDSPERQARQDMDQQIDRMITDDVVAAPSVVQRKREIEDRTATHGRSRRWRQRRQPPMERGVSPDRENIVELQRNLKGIGIGGEGRRGEHPRAEGRAHRAGPVRTIGRGWDGTHHCPADDTLRAYSIGSDQQS